MRRSSAAILLLAAVVLLPSCLEEGDSPFVPLQAPTVLAGVPSSDGTFVTLTWLDNSLGESGFRVDVGAGAIANDGDVMEWTTVPANSNRFVYASLPGTTRYFRVLAVTAAQQSDPSNLILVTTPAVPLPPQHFTALALGSASIDLQWVNDAVSPGNRIERSSDGGGSWTWGMDVGSAPGPSGLTDASALIPATWYRYRIRASNGVGPSAWIYASSTTQTNAAFFPNLSGANSVNNTGFNTSIAVSSGGVDHISHYDLWGGVLLYTTGKVGGSYATSTIDNGSDVPSGPLSPGYYGSSIAASPSGRIRVAAGNYHVDFRMRYIRNTSGSFLKSNVDLIGGHHPKIRVAPLTDVVHVIYRSSVSGNVMHSASANDGGSWATTDATPQIPPGVLPAIAVDSAGTPHVFMSTGSGLYHYWKAGGGIGSWMTEARPIVEGGFQDHISAALDGGDVLHVAFHDVATGQLHHASNTGGDWTVEVVHAHTRGNLGLYNAIAVEPATSRIHISYWNSVNRDLWHATRYPEGKWIHTLIDSSGDVGQFASLALDGGQAHISYYDATNGNLKLVIWSP